MEIICSGGALLFALFLKRCHSLNKKKNLEEIMFFVVLRFLLSGSEAPAKGAATFREKTHFEVNNV